MGGEKLIREDHSEIEIVDDAKRAVWQRHAKPEMFLCRVCPPVRFHHRSSKIGVFHLSFMEFHTRAVDSAHAQADGDTQPATAGVRAPTRDRPGNA